MKKDIGWLYGKAIKVGDERMKMTKENEVKRYNMDSDLDPSGKWIHLDDYQALQKRMEELREGNNKLREQNYCSQCGELFENVGKYKDKLNKAIEVMKTLKNMLKDSDPIIDFLIWFQESGLNMIEDFLKEVEK